LIAALRAAFIPDVPAAHDGPNALDIFASSRLRGQSSSPRDRR
jgi:hypothetical protein